MCELMNLFKSLRRNLASPMNLTTGNSLHLRNLLNVVLLTRMYLAASSAVNSGSSTYASNNISELIIGFLSDSNMRELVLYFSQP